jgi:hypothetical protein
LLFSINFNIINYQLWGSKSVEETALSSTPAIYLNGCATTDNRTPGDR